MNPKLFLNVTPASTLDVQASLQYFEEKNKNGIVTEDTYKGKVIFSITEKGKDGKALYAKGRKKYISSYMDKVTAKIIFSSIANDKFVDRFGKGGIKDYGGSDNLSGELRARITKIYPMFDENTGRITHYVFAIDEGKGKIGAKGGKAIDGEPEITVESWVNYVNALKMANEVYDYIRDEEQISLQNGKPLYTLMYGKNGKPKTLSNDDIETSNQHKGKAEPIIDIKGIFFGRKISDLTDKDLKRFMNLTENNKKAKELYQYAVEEAKKRMGRAL